VTYRPGLTLTEVERTLVTARRAAAEELGGLRAAFGWSPRSRHYQRSIRSLRARHSDLELVTEEMWNAPIPQAHTRAVSIATESVLVARAFLQTTIGDDQASFVGLERVSRSIRGCSGTFVFHDTGTLNGKTVSATWFVVPGSGTGDLLGLGGEGGFTAQLGEGAESRSTTGSNEPIARGLPPEIGDWHCGAAERHRGAPEPLLDALPEQTNTLPPENTGRRKNRRVRSVGR
jgi:hypothetical protein